MASKNRFGLAGKVALITGGGSGLGQAFCEAMAEFGADVACIDIAEEGAQKTVQNITADYGHRAIAIHADVSRQNEVENLVDRTVKELGSIDIVFANAATLDSKITRIHQMAVEDWDRVFALNLRGVFLLMRAVFPIMMRNRSGSFISLASEAGMWPLPQVGPFSMTAAYNTAKSGVIMLTKHAAKQYGEFGIRANIICPGYHRTPMVAGIKEINDDAYLSLVPLRRKGVPEDIKGLGVYLASDASSYVTGQIFVENGGYMA
jgi:NAD(P)-dependent dehydrogenase (short-subunit alcohol dehydrogenase family)